MSLTAITLPSITTHITGMANFRINIRLMLLIVVFKEAAGQFQSNVLQFMSQVQQLLVVVTVGPLTAYTSNEHVVHCTSEFCR